MNKIEPLTDEELAAMPDVGPAFKTIEEWEGTEMTTLRLADNTWREEDEGWEVEWCRRMPHYPDDPTTCDPDRAEMVTRWFRDRGDAYRYAEMVYPESQTGIVLVTPFFLERLCEDVRFSVQHNCHVEYTAEPDHFEGGELQPPKPF